MNKLWKYAIITQAVHYNNRCKFVLWIMRLFSSYVCFYSQAVHCIFSPISFGLKACFSKWGLVYALKLEAAGENEKEHRF